MKYWSKIEILVKKKVLVKKSAILVKKFFSIKNRIKPVFRFDTGFDNLFLVQIQNLIFDVK